MAEPYREEVLNIELARLLSRRGLVSAPETIHHATDGTRLPDVVVNFRGLRVFIEGKTDDVPNAREAVAAQARARVEGGLAHIAVGVVYPAHLRRVPFADLDAVMASAALEIQVQTEAGQGGWVRVSDVDELRGLLVRTYEQLVSEDVVEEAVALVEAGINAFARAVRAIPSGAERIRAVVNVGEPEGEPGGLGIADEEAE